MNNGSPHSGYTTGQSDIAKVTAIYQRPFR